MDLKKIKKIPFGDFSEKSRVRWKVEVRRPVVSGERLLTVDFLRNTECTAYKREDSSFRIVCGKKSREVRGIMAADADKPVRVTDEALRAISGCRHEYILISEKDEAALSRFLGGASQNHYIDLLADWAEEVREERKKRERQKRGELMDEDYRLCPEALPAGLLEFIRETVLPEDDTLVYKKGNVRGLCYACGQTVRARGQRFRQNERVRCPNCGQEVICVLEGSSAFRADFVENVVAVQKGADGETVFFRQWLIQRDPSAHWERIEVFLKETARYAVRGRKTAKWQRESKENYYMNCERYDMEEWTRWSDNRIYDGGYYFCPAGAAEVLKGTAMQYADWEGYLADNTSHWKNPVHFLEYHAKYPVMEFLWKKGYKNIVYERVGGMGRETRDAIRWQRDSLKECFKFPLRFLRLKLPEEWTLDDIARLNALWQMRGEKLKEEEIRMFLEMRIDTKDVLSALPYASVGRILGYIKKQTEKRRAAFGKQHDWQKPQDEAAVAHEYRDYLRECGQLGLSLEDREVLFPKDLRAAHERTMAQVSFEKNKTDQEKFQKAVDRLEKYSWQKDGLLIRPARMQEELREEGIALHHCVGGYIRQMADGETAIFFVRKLDAPDTPYFTLELQKKRVIQCRTAHNASYERYPEILSFVQEWEQEVVTGNGGKKKKEEPAA